MLRWWSATATVIVKDRVEVETWACEWVGRGWRRAIDELVDRVLSASNALSLHAPARPRYPIDAHLVVKLKMRDASRVI